MDDLMGEVNTDKNGLFKVSGATREDSDIEVVLKIYHDCLDEFRVVFMIITYIQSVFELVKNRIQSVAYASLEQNAENAACDDIIDEAQVGQQGSGL